jgi:predicted transcriptional regulator
MSHFSAISEDAHISLIRDILKTYSAVILIKKGRLTGIISKADLLKKL